MTTMVPQGLNQMMGRWKSLGEGLPLQLGALC